MRYNKYMIKSFSCKKTQKIWSGIKVTSLSIELQNHARRKLRMLNNARVIEDLKVPPGNRLEALTGDRKGQFSIRVNQQWRICFMWKDGDATNVHIVDYH
jgi:toxin HigB-1